MHGPGITKFRLTLFKNKAATELEVVELAPWELRDLIWSTHASEKDHLPLLKLAAFGTKANPENDCLRADNNVDAICGVEGDYDKGKLSIDAAVAALRKARLQFLIYASPRYTEAAPRWRVLLCTSQALTAASTKELRALRSKMLARANGVLGGVLGGESFTLSQCYYYGRVGEGTQPPRCEYYDGDPIDLRPDLDAGAQGKQRTKPKAKTKTGDAFERHLAEMGDGGDLRGFNAPLCEATAAYAAMRGKDFDRDALKARLRDAINNAPKSGGP
jgi:hypothetical protein